MSISAVSSPASTYPDPVRAPAAASKNVQAAFSVDGTPPDAPLQPTDPTQQAGAAHHRHHHRAGAGLAFASGTTPRSAAGGSVASALDVLA